MEAPGGSGPCPPTISNTAVRGIIMTKPAPGHGSTTIEVSVKGRLMGRQPGSRLLTPSGILLGSPLTGLRCVIVNLGPERRCRGASGHKGGTELPNLTRRLPGKT